MKLERTKLINWLQIAALWAFLSIARASLVEDQLSLPSSLSTDKISCIGSDTQLRLPPLVSNDGRLDDIVEDKIRISVDGLVLDLSDCGIDAKKVPVVFDAVKRRIPNVKKIILDFNPLGTTGLHRLLKILADFTELESLSLRFCGLVSVDCRSIALFLIKSLKLQSPTYFQELFLSGNEIGNDGLKSLSTALKKGVRIYELYLSHCGISAEGVAYLSEALSSNCRFDLLDLSYNKLDSEALKWLSKSSAANMGKIDKLDLSNNKIGDDGAIALSHLLSLNCQRKDKAKKERKSNHSLGSFVSLNLSSNRIGPEGCAALCAGVTKNSKLQHLNLSGNYPFYRKDFGSINMKKHAYEVGNSISKIYQQLTNDYESSTDKVSTPKKSSSSLNNLCRALKANTTLRSIGLADTGMSSKHLFKMGKSVGAESKLVTVDLSLNPNISDDDVSSFENLLRRER